VINAATSITEQQRFVRALIAQKVQSRVEALDDESI
jgi:hypothetical protein